MIGKHFKRSEFACKCGCGFDTIDYELIVVLEGLREWAGNALLVSSGCRCEKYNAYIGGVKDSQHVKARAADCLVCGKTPQEVYEYLDELYPDKYGLCNYQTFTHIDTRAKKGRW